MGLTIHYTITPRQPIDAVEARRLLFEACAAAYRLTRRRHHGCSWRVEEADPEDAWLHGDVLRREDAHTICAYSVPPLRGRYYEVSPGKGCEPAIFGLCEYPATLRLADGRRLRTGLAGWRFRSCCKTQYAGLHGWEHFFTSHKLVIDAALVWQKLGCDVRITDEGEYWPGRNEAKLRANLDHYDRLVAGLGGALKDAAEVHGVAVESPIFAHPRFEYMEAEGQNAHATAIRQTTGIIAGI
ncbi:MAG: hypothetical protein H7067_06770 [Burkholderiales bacterium]|nr:hypothetical protein [Opitutaceae bacterium]